MQCKYEVTWVYVVIIQEEQFRLKQELAELAIALNLEAQKGRQTDIDYQRSIYTILRKYFKTSMQ